MTLVSVFVAKKEVVFSNERSSVILHFVFILTRCSRQLSCVDPESFARGGPTLTFCEGREDPNSTKKGLAKSVLCWRAYDGIECWLGSFMNFKEIRTSIAKKPSFCDFQGVGGGGPDPCSSLDPRMIVICSLFLLMYFRGILVAYRLLTEFLF